jgi:cell wall-associated NlpC family hydrolase
MRFSVATLAAVALLGAPQALAGGRSWAAPEIDAVTHAGVLASSAAGFRPQAPLTERALQQAIAATDAVQHPPLPPPPAPVPLSLLSTVGPDAVVAGAVTWEVDAPGQTVARADFAVDGAGVATELAAPFSFQLDTTTLADGPHTLAAKVTLTGGGYAIAVWSIAVANAAGATVTPAGSPVPVPVAKSWLPPQTIAPELQAHPAVLFRAATPGRPVSIKQLDATLVAYLGLGGAASEFQGALERAGLQPRPNTGTETVARLLGLRLDHPAREDFLELLPFQAATRAEAAWSFAQVLRLDAWSIQSAQQAADSFALPQLTGWQTRILRTAVSYVGYPYVWGGTSPTAEVEFGVPSAGGFDCSGFVWRVYKLTSYPGERGLAGVLRGRTTYRMSGEVPRRDLIAAAKLSPGDVMFFGAHGRRSSPNVVDHAALYLGGGWLIQSSGQGVTLAPFDGWYRHSFAWGRRPLREAGLS